MRSVVLFVAVSTVLTACAPADTPRETSPDAAPAAVVVTSAPQVPAVRLDDTITVRLELPPRMARLLADSAPGFVPWSLAYFAPDVRANVFPSLRSALSVVIGDFNGDGVLDVVADGYDRTRVLRLALLSDADGWRFLALDGGPFTTTPVPAPNPAARSIEYLALAGPGRYESHYEDAPLVLKSDGFYQVYFEKAAVLNYFDGRKFVTWTATD